ncbi:unnamed protein product [Pleuronectes platessa]|uniref:Uncharacterized protein n=1 Tax=Pleuronectes platessa TaxID=8262 RepID=A0A9N7VF05_PLEPL|nr:unnamed protein product [Pleuronectes platessa]
MPLWEERGDSHGFSAPTTDPCSTHPPVALSSQRHICRICTTERRRAPLPASSQSAVTRNEARAGETERAPRSRGSRRGTNNSRRRRPADHSGNDRAPQRLTSHWADLNSILRCTRIYPPGKEGAGSPVDQPYHWSWVARKSCAGHAGDELLILRVRQQHGARSESVCKQKKLTWPLDKVPPGIPPPITERSRSRYRAGHEALVVVDIDADSEDYRVYAVMLCGSGDTVTKPSEEKQVRIKRTVTA